MTTKIDKARRALNRAIDRYQRREDRFYGRRDDYIALYIAGPSAMELVKQARDLAGRLETMVYDGVGL